MRDLGRLIWSALLLLLRSRAALAPENLVLRQQINVLRRTAPKRLQELLQCDAHAPVLEQGHTVTACRPGDRPHYQPSDLGRAPSPILPDMICGWDTMIETRITKVV